RLRSRGRSVGWLVEEEFNSFGMMRWTSSRVNERSFCGTRETNEAGESITLIPEAAAGSPVVELAQQAGWIQE
ncbi:MAG TPA: hypothetical protein VN345_03525, partial [Blastocatellia bacterium]|nr:hypothetical protein [Blastocatellia bacterium]